MKRSTTMLALVALVLAAGCGGGGKGAAAPAAGDPGDAAAKARPFPDFEVEGESMEVRHGRGGEAAFINNVSILVKNDGAVARTLHVHGVERLHGSCDAPGWNEQTALKMTEPMEDIRLEAGESTRIAVVFEEVECYNACDTFAFRVRFDVDGVDAAVEARLSVIREPIDE